MRKYQIILVSALIVLVFVGCQNPEIENSTENNLIGTYQYVYEHNTEDFIEDHFIRLELKDNVIEGFYYGTSDDFDHGREGYYPGFFVARMVNITIEKNNISFELQLEDNDFFRLPIDLNIVSSNEVDEKINPS